MANHIALALLKNQAALTLRSSSGEAFVWDGEIVNWIARKVGQSPAKVRQFLNRTVLVAEYSEGLEDLFALSNNYALPLVKKLWADFKARIRALTQVLTAA
ncbi:MAG: hypothetical protein HQL11_06275 [Candidatus Omnitrophica bacterium]|nr:hypothetical protein [Candidatus Omnitrophota bacterium]